MAAIRSDATEEFTRYGNPRKKDIGVRAFFHYNKDDPNYRPVYFVQKLVELFKAKNETRLAEDHLGVSSSMLCFIQKKRDHIGAVLLLRVCDLTGMSPNQVREMAGIPIPNDRVVFTVPTIEDKVEDAIAEIEDLIGYANKTTMSSGLNERLYHLLSTLKGGIK